MIKPKDFDESKKYPVFIYVYGEPYAQTVLDELGSGSESTFTASLRTWDTWSCRSTTEARLLRRGRLAAFHLWQSGTAVYRRSSGRTQGARADATVC